MPRQRCKLCSGPELQGMLLQPGIKLTVVSNLQYVSYFSIAADSAIGSVSGIEHEVKLPTKAASASIEAHSTNHQVLPPTPPGATRKGAPFQILNSSMKRGTGTALIHVLGETLQRVDSDVDAGASTRTLRDPPNPKPLNQAYQNQAYTLNTSARRHPGQGIPVAQNCSAPANQMVATRSPDVGSP